MTTRAAAGIADVEYARGRQDAMAGYAAALLHEQAATIALEVTKLLPARDAEADRARAERRARRSYGLSAQHDEAAS